MQPNSWTRTLPALMSDFWDKHPTVQGIARPLKMRTGNSNRSFWRHILNRCTLITIVFGLLFIRRFKLLEARKAGKVSRALTNLCSVGGKTSASMKIDDEKPLPPEHATIGAALLITHHRPCWSGNFSLDDSILRSRQGKRSLQEKRRRRSKKCLVDSFNN